jgi:hypothetical protein
MAVKVKPTIKKVVEPISSVATSLDPKIADTVSVKIKRGGPYGSWGIELFHTAQVPEGSTPEETLDVMMETLTAKAEQYIEANDFNGLTDDLSGSQVEFEEEAGVDPEANTTEETGEEEVTEAEVRMMNRKALIALLANYETDIDPAQYKELGKFRDIVADTLFPAEEEEGETGEEETGEGISEEEIREMDREELEALIEQNELGIDAAKPRKLKDIIEDVIAAISAVGEEETTEEGGAEAELTEEAVREMDREELITLIGEYDLQIDPKKYKKTTALMEVIVEGLFVEDSTETSEFDQTDFGDE